MQGKGSVKESGPANRIGWAKTWSLDGIRVRKTSQGPNKKNDLNKLKQKEGRSWEAEMCYQWKHVVTDLYCFTLLFVA